MAGPVRSEYDAVVVGAGLMGAATAWSLARRGRSVLVIEQFGVGNDRGSSHGSARIVRRAYADPLYTELTGQAFELWRELEQQSGAAILRILGGLDFGRHHDVGSAAEHLRSAGVPHELLSAPEAERRWPGMRFDGAVVFHPQAGTIDAGLAVETFIRESRRHGAELLCETEVTGVRAAAQSAELTLAAGERITAGCAVLAAGAWLEPLAASWLPLPALTVTQQQVFHFPRLAASAEPWPSVIHADAMIYHLAGGRDGGPEDDRKIAEHRHGALTSARSRSGIVDAGSRSRIVEYVKRWLPGFDPTPRAESTCLYTATPNEDFVLDRQGPVVVCSPCSGHGAKFAPLIGELTADLATAPEKAAIPERFRLAAHLASAAS